MIIQAACIVLLFGNTNHFAKTFDEVRPRFYAGQHGALIDAEFHVLLIDARKPAPSGIEFPLSSFGHEEAKLKVARPNTVTRRAKERAKIPLVPLFSFMQYGFSGRKEGRTSVFATIMPTLENTQKISSGDASETPCPFDVIDHLLDLVFTLAGVWLGLWVGNRRRRR